MTKQEAARTHPPAAKDQTVFAVIGLGMIIYGWIVDNPHYGILGFLVVMAALQMRSLQFQREILRRLPERDDD
jgi:hypothetical protein